MIGAILGTIVVGFCICYSTMSCCLSSSEKKHKRVKVLPVYEWNRQPIDYHSQNNVVITNNEPCQSRQDTKATPCLSSSQQTPKPQLQPQINKAKTKRMFGHYECKTCSKKWVSSHSWNGYGQKCLKCRKFVMPSNLYPIQPTLDYVFDCSMCNHTFSMCKTDEENMFSNLFQDFKNINCTHCNKDNTCIKPDFIRMKDLLRYDYIGKCKHCSTYVCLFSKQLSSPMMASCKMCKDEHCFLKMVKKIKSDLTKPHKQDMCGKCQELGRYCGRL